MKILVVDDDFISLEVLRAMLSHYDADILIAQSGRDAIDKALSERPDLILLDHELPDMNGIDVYCDIAAKLGDHTPTAAMITGHDFSTFADSCKAAGIHHHLQKPVSPQELADLLRITSGIE
ncbi:MAG TPA: response regulator [Pseudidiomarina sp.]|nr:response regulator [Pseudidiomarina sp.]